MVEVKWCIKGRTSESSSLVWLGCRVSCAEKAGCGLPYSMAEVRDQASLEKWALPSALGMGVTWLTFQDTQNPNLRSHTGVIPHCSVKLKSKFLKSICRVRNR